MKKNLLLAIILIFSFSCKENETVLSAEDLVEKSIAYHDPNNEWENFQGEFEFSLTYADSSKREGSVMFDFPNSRFQMHNTRDSVATYVEIEDGKCFATLNGSEKFTGEEAEKYRLSCDAIKRMRDYYSYTLGLPMKLKDAGTTIHHKIDTMNFKGEEYLRVKVTYAPEVGEDIWYFYFNPDNYRLEVAQFFHDESINDGEYILMGRKLVEYRSIKFHHKKDWYMNKDDAFLGADIIQAIHSIDSQ